MSEPLLHGVYEATVTDVLDPEALGRVRIRLGSRRVAAWARLATLMAGDRRGTWFVPDVGDNVLVAFEGGDPRQPYVVGALWNKSAPPPETMDAAGANPRRVIATKGGARITLDDAANRLEIRDANGNAIVLEPSGISITAAAKLTITASAVEVNAGMSKFSGIVQSDTLITDSVVASSYTPGAGNIW